MDVLDAISQTAFVVGDKNKFSRSTPGMRYAKSPKRGTWLSSTSGPPSDERLEIMFRHLVDGKDVSVEQRRNTRRRNDP